MSNMQSEKLTPAENVRWIGIMPVCGTCVYGRYDDGLFLCQRNGGFECEAGDLHQWETVCDGYKRPPVQLFEEPAL